MKDDNVQQIAHSAKVLSRAEVEARLRALEHYKGCDAGLTPAEQREFDALTTALYYIKGQRR